MNYPVDPPNEHQKCNIPQMDLIYDDADEVRSSKQEEGEMEEEFEELDQGEGEDDIEEGELPQINCVGRHIRSRGRTGSVIAWKADVQRYVITFHDGDEEEMNETRALAQLVAIDEPHMTPDSEAPAPAPLQPPPKQTKRTRESDAKIAERRVTALQLLTTQGLTAALVLKAWTKAFRDQLENEKQNRQTGKKGITTGADAQTGPPSVRDQRGIQRSREHGGHILDRVRLRFVPPARSVAADCIRQWMRENKEEEGGAYQHPVVQLARQRKVQALKDINRSIVQIPGDGNCMFYMAAMYLAFQENVFDVTKIREKREEIRQEAADYILKNRHNPPFRHLLDALGHMDENAVAQYTNAQRIPCTSATDPQWGDHIHMEALLRVLNLRGMIWGESAETGARVSYLLNVAATGGTVELCARQSLQPDHDNSGNTRKRRGTRNQTTGSGSGRNGKSSIKGARGGTIQLTIPQPTTVQRPTTSNTSSHWNNKEKGTSRHLRGRPTTHKVQ